MSISQKMLSEICNKYKTEEMMQGYDSFIAQYKKKHFAEFKNNISQEDWYRTRDAVLERFVQKYYLK